MGEPRIDAASGSARARAGASGHGDLRALALARPELAWRPGRDIAQARNAHATNTRAQLARALRSEHDWLEGDVRLGRHHRAHMQHLRGERVDLSLDEWLSVAGASGRGVKLDVKEREALPAVLDAVRRAGIEEHRLILNVGPWPAQELLAVRRAFPRAIINLSPVSDRRLTAGDIVQLQLAARIVGGPVMFPIRHDLVTSGVVDALRPLGRVAVWNSPMLTNPDRHSERRLRELGVDGMVDLREPSGVSQQAQSMLVSGAARLFGREPVYRALEAVGLL